VRSAQERLAAGGDRWDIVQHLLAAYRAVESIEKRLAYERLKQLCHQKRRLSDEERADVVTLMQVLVHLS
jgi:hypothetical protein